MIWWLTLIDMAKMLGIAIGGVTAVILTLGIGYMLGCWVYDRWFTK